MNQQAREIIGPVPLLHRLAQLYRWDIQVGVFSGDPDELEGVYLALGGAAHSGIGGSVAIYVTEPEVGPLGDFYVSGSEVGIVIGLGVGFGAGVDVGSGYTATGVIGG